MTTTTDWEKIEGEYRTGLVAVRELARQHGIAEGTIRNRALTRGWVKDLAPAVRAATRDMLLRDSYAPTQGSTQGEVSDDQIVEAAARKGVEVVKCHRRDINEAREIIQGLFKMLKEAAENQTQHIADVVSLMEGNRNHKLKESLIRSLSMGTLTGAARDLAGALRHLTGIERTAFGLDADNGAALPVVNFGVLVGLSSKPPKEKLIN